VFYSIFDDILIGMTRFAAFLRRSFQRKQA
jgi:hypothetical protein